MSQSQFTIPDLLASWPWPRAKNPALDQNLEDEANAWVASLELFEPRQLDKFKACQFSKPIYYFKWFSGLLCSTKIYLLLSLGRSKEEVCGNMHINFICR